MVQSMSAASERVFEFLNEEEEDQTTENPADSWGRNRSSNL